MLHNFAIFLQSHQKNNPWLIYDTPHDHTPIMDYRDREKEIQRMYNVNRAYHKTYNRTYNWVFRDSYECIHIFTCVHFSMCTFDYQDLGHLKISQNPGIKNMALTTSAYEFNCRGISDRRIYTPWFYVHSLHSSQVQTQGHESASQAHYKALWTCTFRCVLSLVYTALLRQSVIYIIHWQLHKVHIHMAAPKSEIRFLHLRLLVISATSRCNGIWDHLILVQ